MSIDCKLSDKISVVTGAAQGIGKSIALEFAKEGARTIIIDKNSEEAYRARDEIISNGHIAEVFVTDVCDSNLVEKCFKKIVKKYGEIHILVNAVGGFHSFDTLSAVSDSEWHHIIDLNLNSTFYSSRSALKYMQKNKFGRIINISSLAGIGPNPHAPSYVPYGAAKAGVIGMTKILAREVGEFGITVNAIAPGTALTPRVQKVRDEESIKNIASKNALQNIIDPIDCARAAVYLASDDGRYVTGITLKVDAGNLIF